MNNDLNRLVEFEDRQEKIIIQLVSSDKLEEYLIQGEAIDIEILKNKTIETKAYQEGRYKLSAQIKW